MQTPALFLALTLIPAPAPGAAPGAPVPLPRIVAGFVGPAAVQACEAAAADLEVQARAAGMPLRARCLWTIST